MLNHGEIPKIYLRVLHCVTGLREVSGGNGDACMSGIIRQRRVHCASLHVQYEHRDPLRYYHMFILTYCLHLTTEHKALYLLKRLFPRKRSDCCMHNVSSCEVSILLSFHSTMATLEAKWLWIKRNGNSGIFKPGSYFYIWCEED